MQILELPSQTTSWLLFDERLLELQQGVQMPVDPNEAQSCGFKQTFTPAKKQKVTDFSKEKVAEAWQRLKSEIEALPQEQSAPIKRKLAWLRKLWHVMTYDPKSQVVIDGWDQILRVLSPSEQTAFLKDVFSDKERARYAQGEFPLGIIAKKRGKVCCRKARTFLARHSLKVAHRELMALKPPVKEKPVKIPEPPMQSWRVAGVPGDDRHPDLGTAIKKQKKAEARPRGQGKFGNREMRRVKSKRQTRQIQLFERGRGKYDLAKFFEELGLELTHGEMLSLMLDSRDGGLGVVGKWRQSQYEGWEAEKTIRLINKLHRGEGCECGGRCEFGQPWIQTPERDLESGEIRLVDAPEVEGQRGSGTAGPPADMTDCPF